MAMVIDTLKLARSLSDAGMDRGQAEALSAGLAQSLKDGDVATKADLMAVKTELKADIDGLRKEVRADLDGLRKEVKLDIAVIRTELVSSRNQILLAMIGVAGLALAVARFAL